jgi:hypothetical protein
MYAPRLLAGLLLLGALGNATAAVFPSAPVTPAETPIPVESMPADLRDKARSVLDTPSLNAKAAAESFHAAPDVYQWLLDNPPIGIKLWRLPPLNARVSDVIEAVPGKFLWKDGQGSEVTWQTAHKGDGMHVWYAEGKIKASALLPASGFRALAVLRYSTGHDADGKPAIRHQVQFFLRCDGRAMSLAARLLGNSAPRLAEQYLGQLQMFYGGMAWYLCQDTARARKMLTQIGVLQEK